RTRDRAGLARQAAPRPAWGAGRVVPPICPDHGVQRAPGCDRDLAADRRAMTTDAGSGTCANADDAPAPHGTDGHYADRRHARRYGERVGPRRVGTGHRLPILAA